MDPAGIVPATEREAECMLRLIAQSLHEPRARASDPERTADLLAFRRSIDVDVEQIKEGGTAELPPGYSLVYIERGVRRWYGVRIPRELRRDHDGAWAAETTLSTIAYAWNHYLLSLPSGMTEVDAEIAADFLPHDKEHVWCTLWELVLFRHTYIIGLVLEHDAAAGPRRFDHERRKLVLTATAIRDAALVRSCVAVADLRNSFSLPSLTSLPEGADVDVFQLEWVGFLHTFFGTQARHDGFRWWKLAEERARIAMAKPSKKALIQEACRAWASTALMYLALAHHYLAVADKRPERRVEASRRASIFLEKSSNACKAICAFGLDPSGSSRTDDNLRWARRYMKKKSSRLDAVLKKTFLAWTTPVPSAGGVSDAVP